MPPAMSQPLVTVTLKHLTKPWSYTIEGDAGIGSKYKHVKNIAMHGLHNFFGILQTQQLTFWAYTRLHVLLLQISMTKLSLATKAMVMGRIWTSAVPYMLRCWTPLFCMNF